MQVQNIPLEGPMILRKRPSHKNKTGQAIQAKWPTEWSRFVWFLSPFHPISHESRFHPTAQVFLVFLSAPLPYLVSNELHLVNFLCNIGKYTMNKPCDPSIWKKIVCFFVFWVPADFSAGFQGTARMVQLSATWIRRLSQAHGLWLPAPSDSTVEVESWICDSNRCNSLFFYVT